MGERVPCNGHRREETAISWNCCGKRGRRNEVHQSEFWVRREFNIIHIPALIPPATLTANRPAVGWARKTPGFPPAADPPPPLASLSHGFRAAEPTLGGSAEPPPETPYRRPR